MTNLQPTPETTSPSAGNSVVTRVTAFRRALPSTSLGAIASAKMGGAATSAFFQQKDQILALSSALAQGQSTWVKSTDSQTGQPVAFAVVGVGENPTVMTIHSYLNMAVLAGQEQPAESWTWNGNSYSVAGSHLITYSSGSYATVTPVDIGVAFGETAIPTTLFAIAILDMLLTGGNTGLGQLNLAAQAGNAIDAGAADEASSTASTVDTLTADAGTAELLEGAAISEIAVAWGVFLGPLAAAAVVYAIVEVMHQTQHRFTVYNLTTSDVTWTAAFISEGDLAQGPIQPTDDSAPNPSYIPNYVISGGGPYSPSSDIVPIDMFNDAEFQYTSGELTGLGYVFTLTFSDSTSGANYTAAFTFDIPFAGANSLNCTFDDIPDYSEWYSSSEGQNCITSLSALSSDGKYQLTVTYDLLQGQQPGPNGDTGYYYNSLVVLEDLSITAGTSVPSPSVLPFGATVF